MQIGDDDVGTFRQRNLLRVTLKELDAVAEPVDSGHLTRHRDRVIDFDGEDPPGTEPTREHREEAGCPGSEVEHHRIRRDRPT